MCLKLKRTRVKQYLPLVVIFVIFVAIALTQIPIIENIWLYSFDDGTYSHAYLIPFISMYIYWVLFVSGELKFNNKINYLTLFITIALASVFICLFCCPVFYWV